MGDEPMRAFEFSQGDDPSDYVKGYRAGFKAHGLSERSMLEEEA